MLRLLIVNAVKTVTTTGPAQPQTTGRVRPASKSMGAAARAECQAAARLLHSARKLAPLRPFRVTLAPARDDELVTKRVVGV